MAGAGNGGSVPRCGLTFKIRCVYIGRGYLWRSRQRIKQPLRQFVFLRNSRGPGWEVYGRVLK